MFNKEPAKNPLTFQLDKTGSQLLVSKGFPDHSDSEESVCKAGDPGWIPRLGRSPGGGHGNPFQYFLPGKSPWTEEPGRLQSMASERVRHDE